MFLRVILMCPRSLFQSLCKFSVEEVEDPGNQREKVLPPDTGHGFLWRLYSHWRFEERDDGVYVECRAISLTRDVPFGLRWAIEPIIQKLPQESLTKTLEAARTALQARKQFVLFWLGATAERRGLRFSNCFSCNSQEWMAFRQRSRAVTSCLQRESAAQCPALIRLSAVAVPGDASVAPGREQFGMNPAEWALAMSRATYPRLLQHFPGGGISAA
jgi:hypothetical protein